MRDPYVYFQCLTCKWRHDVPQKHVVLVHGIPQSPYVPFHTCEGGADVEERGGFEVEVVSTMPAHNFKLTLE